MVYPFKTDGVLCRDVVVFPNNTFKIDGITGGPHTLLTEKTVLFVIQDKPEVRLPISRENVLFLTKNRVFIEGERFDVDCTEKCFLMWGPINKIFRDCCEIQKLFKVKFIRYSKPNHYIRGRVRKCDGFDEGRSSFEVAKFLLRRQILTDIWLAMCPLELPDYVVLEIIDWLELLFFDDHKEKIGLIQGLSRSRRKIKNLD